MNTSAIAQLLHDAFWVCTEEGIEGGAIVFALLAHSELVGCCGAYSEEVTRLRKIDVPFHQSSVACHLKILGESLDWWNGT